MDVVMMRLSVIVVVIFSIAVLPSYQFTSGGTNPFGGFFPPAIVEPTWMKELRVIRKQIAELKTYILPESCDESNLSGKRILRSGDIVFCENGWTVFQRNFGTTMDFENKLWHDYKFGFGVLTEDFWLGLDIVYRLTVNRTCRLMVELWDIKQEGDDDYQYATYETFSIGSESDFYRIRVSGFNASSTDGIIDCLNYQNNAKFSTKDSDTDSSKYKSCAVSDKGGFWYKACSCTQLNREPGTIQWRPKLGWDRSLMKFRCD